MTTRARLGFLVVALLARPVAAATINVSSGADLQPALNAAAGGDTIVLQAGVTYQGNFVLPVHPGSGFVTIRTSTGDALLPAPGTRISPAAAGLLPTIRSGNTSAALRTAPGAAYWRIAYVAFAANAKGSGDIIQLGDGSATQNTLAAVPQQLVLQSVYVHGDPLVGQKRGIALNSGDTTIADSYVSDIKGVGIDTQAIGGWNGPGPYRIENNYLEAAGEVLMLGGDDPKIANLVPSDVVVYGNTLTRPVAWRDPIIAAPTNVIAAETAGALPAAVYGYRVVARRPADSASIATSPASLEVTISLSQPGGALLQWNAVPDATEYRVYGRTPGAPDRYWTVAAPTTSFADTGTAGTAGTPPKATVWTVKNILELKNARRVQADHNLLEHNWAQAQSGIAVVLTPRNQGGGCPWCVVEDVTFEYNRVRGVGAGVSILGWDNLQPSQQANTIRIRNNEFSDVSKTWGGNGYFLSIMDNPRDIVIDHNTIISPDGSGVVNASGTPTTGFIFTNNLARHNAYGIIGSGYGIGNSSIAYYFPGGVVTSNVLAGGTASLYPAGNLFPTTTDFERQFLNYAGGDFTLSSTSLWRNAGTDGADLGADLYNGIAPLANNAPVATDATVAALEETAVNVTLGGTDADGDALVFGLATSPQYGTLAGTAPQLVYTGATNFFGTDSFTFTVSDPQGATSTGTITISVANVNDAPTTSSQSLSTAQNTPLAITLVAQDVDGDPLSWSFAPPQYGSLSGSGPQLTYTPPAGFIGTDSFTYTVSDGTVSVPGTVTITVTGQPLTIATTTLPDAKLNRAYSTTLSATGGGTPYRWTIVAGQLPAGIALDAGAGLLSGKPTAAGTFAFTLRVTDAWGQVDDQALTLKVVTTGRK